MEYVGLLRTPRAIPRLWWDRSWLRGAKGGHPAGCHCISARTPVAKRAGAGAGLREETSPKCSGSGLFEKLDPFF